MFARPGYAPSTETWFIWVAVQTAALTAYSGIPKPLVLHLLSPIVLIVLAALPLFVAWRISPDAVGNNAMWLAAFSMFTFGGPLWAPVVTLTLHARLSTTDSEDDITKTDT
jgi:hypothetical protein